MDHKLLNQINLALEASMKATKLANDTEYHKLNGKIIGNTLYKSMLGLWDIQDQIYSAYPDLKPQDLVEGEQEELSIKSKKLEIVKLIESGELDQAYSLAKQLKESCVTGYAEAGVHGLMGRIEILRSK